MRFLMNKSQWEAGGNGEDCCILVCRISFGPFVSVCEQIKAAVLGQREYGSTIGVIAWNSLG